MTDRSGERHSLSLPPGAVRTEHLARFRELASTCMPPAMAEVLRKTPEPFVQVIYDIDVENMAFGAHRPHGGRRIRRPTARGSRYRQGLRGRVDPARRASRRGRRSGDRPRALGAGAAHPRPAARRADPGNGGPFPVPPHLGPRRSVPSPRPVRAGAIAGPSQPSNLPAACRRSPNAPIPIESPHRDSAGPHAVHPEWRQRETGHQASGFEVCPQSAGWLGS